MPLKADKPRIGMHGIPLRDEKGMCRCLVIDERDVPAFEQVMLGELDKRIIVKDIANGKIGYLLNGFIICAINKPCSDSSCFIEFPSVKADNPDFPLYIQALLHAHWRAKELQAEFDEQKGADSEKANQS